MNDYTWHRGQRISVALIVAVTVGVLVLFAVPSGTAVAQHAYCYRCDQLVNVNGNWTGASRTVRALCGTCSDPERRCTSAMQDLEQRIDELRQGLAWLNQLMAQALAETPVDRELARICADSIYIHQRDLSLLLQLLDRMRQECSAQDAVDALDALNPTATTPGHPRGTDVGRHADDVDPVLEALDSLRRTTIPGGPSGTNVDRDASTGPSGSTSSRATSDAAAEPVPQKSLNEQLRDRRDRMRRAWAGTEGNGQPPDPLSVESAGPVGAYLGALRDRVGPVVAAAFEPEAAEPEHNLVGRTPTGVGGEQVGPAVAPSLEPEAAEPGSNLVDRMPTKAPAEKVSPTMAAGLEPPAAEPGHNISGGLGRGTAPTWALSDKGLAEPTLADVEEDLPGNPTDATLRRITRHNDNAVAYGDALQHTESALQTALQADDPEKALALTDHGLYLAQMGQQELREVEEDWTGVVRDLYRQSEGFEEAARALGVTPEQALQRWQDEVRRDGLPAKYVEDLRNAGWSDPQIAQRRDELATTDLAEAVEAHQRFRALAMLRLPEARPGNTGGWAAEPRPVEDAEWELVMLRLLHLRGHLAPPSAEPKAADATLDRDWGPEQATGAPDTEYAGDRSTAWAPSQKDAGQEWLQLTYETAVEIAEVRIRETFNPGAVTKVSAIADDDSEVLLWEGDDPTATAPEDLVVTTDQAVTARVIKVYLDTRRRSGWNEFDAVELIATDGTRQWAVKAKASSTYAER